MSSTSTSFSLYMDRSLIRFNSILLFCVVIQTSDTTFYYRLFCLCFFFVDAAVFFLTPFRWKFIQNQKKKINSIWNWMATIITINNSWPFGFSKEKKICFEIGIFFLFLFSFNSSNNQLSSNLFFCLIQLNHTMFVCVTVCVCTCVWISQ